MLFQDDKGRIPLVAPIEDGAVIDCMLCMLDTFVGAVNKDGFLGKLFFYVSLFMLELKNSSSDKNTENHTLQIFDDSTSCKFVNFFEVKSDKLGFRVIQC